MSTLLLQSCSASKNEVNRPTPAFDLYSGYFYKILKKSIREEEIRSDVTITILSAEHGLISRTEEIDYYDRRMDRERAQELNEEVVESLVSQVEEGGYERIVVNMGQTYREAIAGLSDRINETIAEIPGEGIGEKGNALYQFIRGDDSVVEVREDV